MRDTELHGRLVDLGMSPSHAAEVTRRIRDELHPVAAVAAIKVHRVAGYPESMPGLAGNVASSMSLASTGSKVGGAVGAGMVGTAAAAGSVVPVIGTAIGAALGLVAGLLIKKGHGAERAAMSNQLVNSLSQIPSAYVGRTIPWNQTGATPGLFQFLESCFLVAESSQGGWMNWARDLTKSPTMMGNWATTYINGLKQVVAAILQNPPGAAISLDISATPGGSNARPGPFTFVNPGIAVGPEAITAQVLMPMVAYLMNKTGESPAHAQDAASSPCAQKVFALMVDHAVSDLQPSSVSSLLANAPIATVPAGIAAPAQQLAAAIVAGGQIPQLATNIIQAPATIPPSLPSMPNQIPTSSLVPSPIDSVLSPVQDSTAGILQSLLAGQGMNFQSPPAQQVLADVAATGVSKTPRGPSSIPAWVLPVGIGVGALLLFGAFTRGRRNR